MSNEHCGYIVEVKEVLGQMQFKKKYPEQFKQWLEVSKSHYWLYSRSSDKFIIANCNESEEHPLGIFVRTKQGGWFGIGDFWDSAALDVTGILWEGLISRINEFIFTPEEKQKIIENNELWKKGQLKLV